MVIGYKQLRLVGQVVLKVARSIGILTRHLSHIKTLRLDTIVIYHTEFALSHSTVRVVILWCGNDDREVHTSLPFRIPRECLLGVVILVIGSQRRHWKQCEQRSSNCSHQQ